MSEQTHPYLKAFAPSCQTFEWEPDVNNFAGSKLFRNSAPTASYILCISAGSNGCRTVRSRGGIPHVVCGIAHCNECREASCNLPCQRHDFELA
jgi:hypothetical protein